MCISNLSFVLLRYGFNLSCKLSTVDSKCLCQIYFLTNYFSILFFDIRGMFVTLHVEFRLSEDFYTLISNRGFRGFLFHFVVTWTKSIISGLTSLMIETALLLFLKSTRYGPCLLFSGVIVHVSDTINNVIFLWNVITCSASQILNFSDDVTKATQAFG